MLPACFPGKRVFLESILLIPFLTVLIGVSPSVAQDLDVPYVPTPQRVVDRMLEIAHVGPGDYVIDLGSGDGRIVIAAAKLGATAHGVDLDPERVRESRENARSQGVEDQAMFLQGNIFEAEISQASVITLYLLPSVNRDLRPRLFDMLRPGTRVVSHSFTMGGWEADASFESGEKLQGYHSIYFWVMPAEARGVWRWKVDDQVFTLNVKQQFQEIDLTLRAGERALMTYNQVLRGERISFAAEDGNRRYRFNGRIEGDDISGYVQLRGNDNYRLQSWTARRP